VTSYQVDSSSGFGTLFLTDELPAADLTFAMLSILQCSVRYARNRCCRHQ